MGYLCYSGLANTVWSLFIKYITLPSNHVVSAWVVYCIFGLLQVKLALYWNLIDNRLSKLFKQFKTLVSKIIITTYF